MRVVLNLNVIIKSGSASKKPKKVLIATLKSLVAGLPLWTSHWKLYTNILITCSSDLYSTVLMFLHYYFTYLLYCHLFFTTSLGSVALHDDVTSPDPCQPGAGLRFHGDGPDEPTEHTGQHGQHGAAPRQAPHQGSHLRH